MKPNVRVVKYVTGLIYIPTAGNKLSKHTKVIYIYVIKPTNAHI
jgi:hypothetical protein